MIQKRQIGYWEIPDNLPRRLLSIKSSNCTPQCDDKEHPRLLLQSIQHSLPSSQQGDLATKRMSRLPTTTTLNADLSTLKFHLTLRVKEIIACSELMWDWVEQLWWTWRNFDRLSCQQWHIWTSCRDKSIQSASVEDVTMTEDAQNTTWNANDDLEQSWQCPSAPNMMVCNSILNLISLSN